MFESRLLNSSSWITVTELSLFDKDVVGITVSTDTMSVLWSQRHCLSLSGKDDVTFGTSAFTKNTNTRMCLVSNKNHIQMLVTQMDRDNNQMPMIASITPRTSSSTTARSSSTRTGLTMLTTTMGRLRVFFRNVSLTQKASH